MEKQWMSLTPDSKVHLYFEVETGEVIEQVTDRGRYSTVGSLGRPMFVGEDHLKKAMTYVEQQSKG